MVARRLSSHVNWMIAIQNVITILLLRVAQANLVEYTNQAYY